MSLGQEERDAVVQYRIEKSASTMAEFETNYAAGHYTLAIQRLYYASYYLASALLVANKIMAQTHGGVKAMLHKEFVQTGKLPAEDGRTYSILLNKRHEGDYDDCFDFTKGDVDDLLPAALHLQSELKRLLGIEQVLG